MTIAASGAISFDNFRTEFGKSGAISLGDLYRGGSYVSDNAITNDEFAMPSSGAISVGDFQGVSGNHTYKRDIYCQWSRGDGNSSYKRAAYGATSISDWSSDWVTTTAYTTETGSYDGKNGTEYYNYYVNTTLAGRAGQVFRAGRGFITSLNITTRYNEDNNAVTRWLQLYGSTTYDGTFEEIVRWSTNSSGSSGGTRSYNLSWYTTGELQSVTETATSGSGAKPYISVNNTSTKTNKRWFRLVANVNGEASDGRNNKSINVFDWGTTTALPGSNFNPDFIYQPKIGTAPASAQTRDTMS